MTCPLAVLENPTDKIINKQAGIAERIKNSS
jgi:hypothetical protein